MDTRTGRIYDVSEDGEQKRIEKKLGRKLMPLTNEQAAQMRPLNRHDRRAWAAQERLRQRAERKAVAK